VLKWADGLIETAKLRNQVVVLEPPTDSIVVISVGKVRYRQLEVNHVVERYKCSHSQISP
jgi:hypothetical protein